jgi:hypothetical protein
MCNSIVVYCVSKTLLHWALFLLLWVSLSHTFPNPFSFCQKMLINQNILCASQPETMTHEAVCQMLINQTLCLCASPPETMTYEADGDGPPSAAAAAAAEEGSGGHGGKGKGVAAPPRLTSLLSETVVSAVVSVN